MQELSEVIGGEATGPASPVTPEHSSRPQTPDTPGPAQISKDLVSQMTSQQGMSVMVPPPVMMSQEQLQQMFQQLTYRPPITSNPKVEDPELYHGERTKLRAFLTQCELKFNCEPNKFDSDIKRVNYASSRCRGNAWSWIEPSIEEGRSTYTTWAAFKTAISRAFGEADSKEVARRKFKNVRQGNRSAAAYWAEFQRIIADLRYNDEIYIDQFSDGLHIDVQRQLAILDTRPTKVIDFANQAIALDNRLFNFRTLRNRYEPQYQNFHQKNNHQGSTFSEPEPMELDATWRGKPRDKAEEEKRRRNNECYNCGRTGHYAAKCPHKKPRGERRPYQAAETNMDEEPVEERAGKENPQE